MNVGKSIDVTLNSNASWLTGTRELLEFLNSNPAEAPSFAAATSKAIRENCGSEERLVRLLDLMDFLSIRNRALAAEFGRKSFLREVNAIFRLSESEPAKARVLELVSVWKHHFEGPELPNFAWYARSIEERGITLPPPGPSKFEREQPLHFAQFSETQRRLVANLNVVQDNLNLVNAMIDNGELEACLDVIQRMGDNEKRLRELPPKLLARQDALLLAYTSALIKDYEFTLQRARLLKAKKSLPTFTSLSQPAQAAIYLDPLPPPPSKKAAPNDYAPSTSKKLDPSYEPSLLDIDLTPTPASTPVSKSNPVSNPQNVNSFSENMVNLNLAPTPQPPAQTLNIANPIRLLEEVPKAEPHNPSDEITFNRVEKEVVKSSNAVEYDPFAGIDEHSILKKEFAPKKPEEVEWGEAMDSDFGKQSEIPRQNELDDINFEL